MSKKVERVSKRHWFLFNSDQCLNFLGQILKIDIKLPIDSIGHPLAPNIGSYSINCRRKPSFGKIQNLFFWTKRMLSAELQCNLCMTYATTNVALLEIPALPWTKTDPPDDIHSSMKSFTYYYIIINQIKLSN